MTEIRFYHMTRSSLDKALPELLEKTLQKGWRAVVWAKNNDEITEISSLLWSFKPESFLPHGTKKDGHEAETPIWLTAKAENPNGAQVLFVVDGRPVEAMEGIDLVCDLFDGLDGEAEAAARQRWTAYKKQKHTLAYWKQTENGWTTPKGLS